jgi:hypothetical protein
MTSPLPSVDDAYTRRVFDALSRMEVSLDADPLQYGPKRLNKKVAECREHLSRCQQIFLQVSDDLQRINRAHRQAKLDFDLQLQDLFANDIEVRSGRNVRDREAIAMTKLRDERQKILDLETSIADLEAVMSVVKAKREDLKDIQGRIRDQVKLCQEEIGLGSRWGSALPPGERGPDLVNAPRVDVGMVNQARSLVGDDADLGVGDLDAFLNQELTLQGRAAEIVAPPAQPEPPEVARAQPSVAPEVVAQPSTPPPSPASVAGSDPELDPLADMPVADGVPEALQTSVQDADVDSFLDGMDLAPVTKPAKGTKPVAASDEVDLDDLLGNL